MAIANPFNIIKVDIIEPTSARISDILVYYID